MSRFGGSLGCLVWVVAASGGLGCGSDPAAGGPDAETVGDGRLEVPEETLEGGDFVVSEVALEGTCSTGQLPEAGDTVRLEAGGVLAWRDLRVARSTASGVVFEACEAVDDDGDGGADEYTQSTWTLNETAGGYEVALSYDRISGGTASLCLGATLTLRKLQACELAGRWAATTSELVSGTCDLSWAPAEVVVSLEEEGATIDWDSSTYDDARVDEAACSVSATRGVSSARVIDSWSYKGAQRQVQLELKLDGATGLAIAQDHLAGTTTDGEICENAVIEIALERVTGLLEGAPLAPAVCAFERPAVCGDGVCAATETCATCSDDCGCGAGQECVGWSDASCRTPCEDPLAVGQCAAGERCSPDGSSDFAIFDTDPAYCEPSGGGQLGEPCEGLTGCADGLLCLRSRDAIHSKIGVCSAPCGTCAEGESCEATSDGTHVGSYPTAARGCAETCELFVSGSCRPGLVCSDRGGSGATCVARAASAEGVGASCVDDPCAPGLACVSLTSEGVSQTVCALPCDVSADCSAVGGGECLSVGGSFGICR